MRLIALLLIVLLNGCATNKEEWNCTCIPQFSNSELTEIKSKIDSGDKKAAYALFSSAITNYDQKKDFPYYVKAFKLTNDPNHLDFIINKVSRIDDIYACKDLLDFLNSIDSPNKNDLQKNVWCTSLWKDEDFAKWAMLNRKIDGGH